jgi:hypothetical protein
MAEQDRERLEQAMAQAVAEEDFERAATLRDRIAALAPKPEPPDTETMFKRQVPGRMGLGTSEEIFKPPEGWVKPKRPNLGVANIKPRKGGR